MIEYTAIAIVEKIADVAKPLLEIWKMRKQIHAPNSGKLNRAIKASLNLLSVLVFISEMRIIKKRITPVVMNGNGQ
jgi:hypothetical protein